MSIGHLISCLVPPLLSLACLSPTHAAALELQLSNLRPSGEVRVEVFADAAAWKRGRHPIASQRFAARTVRQTLRLDGLAPGRYALRVVQEADPSGLIHGPASFAFPRRGYSRVRQRSGGRPSFEQAAVALDAAQAAVPIRVYMIVTGY